MLLRFAGGPGCEAVQVGGNVRMEARSRHDLPGRPPLVPSTPNTHHPTPHWSGLLTVPRSSLLTFESSTVIHRCQCPNPESSRHRPQKQSKRRKETQISPTSPKATLPKIRKKQRKRRFSGTGKENWCGGVPERSETRLWDLRFLLLEGLCVDMRVSWGL